jgi:adhesin transport system outer membrane protein
LLAGISLVAASPAPAQPELPAPSAAPLDIDFANDPVLSLARKSEDFEAFRAAIAAAVLRHPANAEGAASQAEAKALVDQARDALLPSIDVSVQSYRVLSREFSNDPFNIIERSRPERRTDALLNVRQPLIDFGAGANKVRAAGARLRAASADLQASADQVALQTIAAWYDVFGYGVLVDLSQSSIDGQKGLRTLVEERVRQGASAEGDLARIDSYVAQSQTRLAQYQRLLDNARARFEELSGKPTPLRLERAPLPGQAMMSRDMAEFAAGRDVPQVRSADAQADAARLEARAAKQSQLPQVSVGIDAGRYGVFENAKDYDVRGLVLLQQHLFGGGHVRTSQYEARSNAAAAHADRVREEAVRDAAIAWSDVEALQRQLDSLQSAYVAGRRSRDVIVARFLASRGTYLDVIAADDAYFEDATAYVQALMELDAARYVLLSRTGGLLDVLRIEPDQLGAMRE